MGVSTLGTVHGNHRGLDKRTHACTPALTNYRAILEAADSSKDPALGSRSPYSLAAVHVVIRDEQLLKMITVAE